MRVNIPAMVQITAEVIDIMSPEKKIIQQIKSKVGL